MGSKPFHRFRAGFNISLIMISFQGFFPVFLVIFEIPGYYQVLEGNCQIPVYFPKSGRHGNPVINNLITDKWCNSNQDKICPQCTHHSAADTETYVSEFKLPMLLIPGLESSLTLYQDLNCHRHMLLGTEMSLTFYEDQKCQCRVLPDGLCQAITAITF